MKNIPLLFIATLHSFLKTIYKDKIPLTLTLSPFGGEEKGEGEKAQFGQQL